MGDVVFLLGFGSAVVVLPMATLAVLSRFRPQLPERVKAEGYESGMPQASVPRRPFHMAYYNFALIFVVFDVEAVLLFAVAGVLRDLELVATIKTAVFVILVADGLLYAWRKGALVWR